MDAKFFSMLLEKYFIKDKHSIDVSFNLSSLSMQRGNHGFSFKVIASLLIHGFICVTDLDIV